MPWREGLVPFRWPTTLSYKLPVLAWIVVERWITMCQLPTCFFGSPPRNLTNLPLKKRVFLLSVWNLSIKAWICRTSKSLQSRSIPRVQFDIPQGLVPKRWRPTWPACINTEVSQRPAMAMEGHHGQQHGGYLAPARGTQTERIMNHYDTVDGRNPAPADR